MTDKNLQEIKETLREMLALLRELRELLYLLKNEKTLREREPSYPERWPYIRPPWWPPAFWSETWTYTPGSFSNPIVHPPWVYGKAGWVPVVDEAEVPLPEGKSEVKGNTGG